MGNARGVVLVALVACGAAGGEPAKEDRIPEIIVTATRHEMEVFDVPYSATLFREWDIRTRQMSRTVPEILTEEPSIMVQKTGRGQGSPFIRGFTGFHTLFLIDGIRLNNSVFRDGPNQYWATVDPLLVSRLEVVKGPSSVLYGSDAIGGTVNVITRGRETFPEGFHWDRRIYYRFATADNSKTGRAEISGTLDHTLGFLFGFSLRDFGDLEAGQGVGRQPKTGYDERSCDARIDYFLDRDNRFVLGFQRHRQDDAWRTHKTIYGVSWHGTTVGSEKERVLDQSRDLAYVQYHGRNLGLFFETASVSLSYQVQGEERFRIKSNGQSDRQGFTVRTLGLWAQFSSDTPLGLLTYGAEFYRDNVRSFKRKYNADGTLKSIGIQGPVADDATYDLLGIFIQDEFPILENLEATVGLRYTYARADADSVQDPVTGEEISLSDSWDNAVGSARLLYHAGEHWNIYGGVSQGFRAPNLSDLTRLDTARTNEIETPSPGLDPERFISCEIGLKADYERWSVQIAYFYTAIRDMIVRFPTGRIVEGDAEVRKANVGDGFVHGVELQGEFRLDRKWSLFSGLAWQQGEVDTFPTSAQVEEREPMSRIPPLTALIGARWRHPSGRLWFEAVARMADKQDRLSPRDKTDTQRIPPGGTPGYAVFDIRGGVKVNENLTVSAAVENILDTAYRIHGSGLNEPGRNFIVSADWRF